MLYSVLSHGREWFFTDLLKSAKSRRESLQNPAQGRAGASLVVGQLGLFYTLWHLQSCLQGHLHKEETTCRVKTGTSSAEIITEGQEQVNDRGRAVRLQVHV